LTKGLFIVLEGVEGAGKSTQAALLSEWFDALGLPHSLAREPGGTPVGEAIRGLVLERTDLEIPAETELFLILAARAAYTREVVVPALDAGKLVLSDRFDLSTLAYQGFARGLDLDQVRRANRMATGGLRPDLYLVLDVPAELGMERKAKGARDRIEREGLTFLSRVREGYRTLVGETPEARLVEAQGSPVEVQSTLRRILAEAFSETFSAPRV
jgi:dTMP kinase